MKKNNIKVNFSTMMILVILIYTNKFKFSKNYASSLEDKWSKINLKF